MIQQIRIQNFRSLKDVTLDLQQVNLLIGPNNSGKTNVLKALVFFGEIINSRVTESDFERNLSKRNLNSVFDFSLLVDHFPIQFSVNYEDVNDDLSSTFIFWEILIKSQNQYKGIIGFRRSQEPIAKVGLHSYDKKEELNKQFFYYYTFDKSDDDLEDDYDRNAYAELKTSRVFLKKIFGNLSINKPNPETFSSSSDIKSVSRMDADGSNIVPFLFGLSQNYKKKFKQLEEDLKRCVGDIVSVATPPDPAENGKLKLKFFDAYDNDYWADEVSEGVLYFLAILCIIHQPDPPKLLLLEEPEKGIHPRRIREVMDFIFNLAQEKGIQVIMTTHDTYVVDQFADIPEAVFVFDKKDGATEVKNLQKDVIEPADKLSEENGLPPTNYTRGLGEHWAAGFLGGVPR